MQKPENQEVINSVLFKGIKAKPKRISYKRLLSLRRKNLHGRDGKRTTVSGEIL